MKPQDLENRWIDFAVVLVGIVEELPESKAGNHIGGQFIRSGTSPAPKYGESQSAEFRKDFVHKMKISLKELRETMVWLKISLVQGQECPCSFRPCCADKFCPSSHSK